MNMDVMPFNTPKPYFLWLEACSPCILRACGISAWPASSLIPKVCLNYSLEAVVVGFGDLLLRHES